MGPGNIIDMTVNGENVNLVTEYGKATMEQIRNHAATYVNNSSRPT